MNLPRFTFGTLCFVAWTALNFEAAAQPSSGPSLGVQEWCSDQARRVSENLGLRASHGDTTRNHYNTNLHVCFMAIESHRGTAVTKTLLDAYALRTYASYFSMANSGSLKLCVLMPPATEKRICNSDSEYEAFVTHYIQQ